MGRLLMSNSRDLGRQFPSVCLCNKCLPQQPSAGRDLKGSQQHTGSRLYPNPSPRMQPPTSPVKSSKIQKPPFVLFNIQESSSAEYSHVAGDKMMHINEVFKMHQAGPHSPVLFVLPLLNVFWQDFCSVQPEVDRVICEITLWDISIRYIYLS